MFSCFGHMIVVAVEEAFEPMLSDKRFQARRTEPECSAGACPPLPAPAGDKPLHYGAGYRHVTRTARGNAHLPRANLLRTVLPHEPLLDAPSPWTERRPGGEVR